MITEDYVSFETAKLLKKKGFDKSISHVYSNNGELLRLCDYGIRDLTNTECNGYSEWQFPIEDVDTIISAPTLWEAMKWLRKVHSIDIDIISRLSLNADNDHCYSYVIKHQYDKYHYRTYSEGECLAPEEIAESAIKFCLEKLI